jgi:hypothetical protein
VGAHPSVDRAPAAFTGSEGNRPEPARLPVGRAVLAEAPGSAQSADRQDLAMSSCRCSTHCRCHQPMQPVTEAEMRAAVRCRLTLDATLNRPSPPHVVELARRYGIEPLVVERTGRRR